MRAELRAVTAAAGRKRAAGKQAAKATEISSDLPQALWSFYESDEYRVQDYAELKEVEQAGHRAHILEILAALNVFRESIPSDYLWIGNRRH